MGRLPFFDPAKMAVRREPEGTGSGGVTGKASGPASPAPITVSQLCVLIDRTLRDHIATGVRVVGEIGQFRERTHWYFDLKDSGGLISCVMWQSAARKVGFTPGPGQQVVISGRVEFYPTQGRTQLIVDKVEPVGAGALDLAFKKLLEEIRGLGWMDPGRKRTLPAFPTRVAVITSRTGAALQDVIDTVARRCPSLKLALVDVRVQGEGAKEQIAHAIRAVGRRHADLGIDLILLTRGGGSIEDLWAFNERIVAEAIVHCPIPVVAAIGHETDTTIAELVADLRCATPTQAAMRIAPDRDALLRQLDSHQARLGSMLTRQVQLDEQRLRAATRHRVFAHSLGLVQSRVSTTDVLQARVRQAVRDRLDAFDDRVESLHRRLDCHRPTTTFAHGQQQLDALAMRLHAAVVSAMSRRDVEPAVGRLHAAIGGLVRARAAAAESAARALDLVGPAGVLARGYSVTFGPDGKVLRSIAGVTPGQGVRTRVSDGEFAAIVTGEGATGRALPVVPQARRPKRAGAHPAHGTMDLFGGNG